MICPLITDSEEGNQQISFETLGATSQGTCWSGISEEVIFQPVWFPRPSCFLSAVDKALAFSVSGEAEKEWDEHKDALSAVTNNNPGSSGLPSTTMRTGGNVPSVSKGNAPSSAFPGLVSFYQLTHLYSIFGKNPVQLNSNQVVNISS